MADDQLIVFGAGGAGRYVLSHLRSQAAEPICFVDNSSTLQGKTISGLPVLDPSSALLLHPGATWVAAAISCPAAREIRSQIQSMKVSTKHLWECLPVCHGLPPSPVIDEIAALLRHDHFGLSEWWDQLRFRANPDYDKQRGPSDIKGIYFPNWIMHKEDEHFVDCGAADGDTVEAFRSRWRDYDYIDAFEPDRKNWGVTCEANLGNDRFSIHPFAVGDRQENLSFVHAGDYSSHLTGGKGNDNFYESVLMVTLDETNFSTPPTYIKFDIEGSELEALWGARGILSTNKPVLAVCAYHKSEHLWQIPLLLHALQPEYKLFLRRYAEGAFELVYYAVPAERVYE